MTTRRAYPCVGSALAVSHAPTSSNRHSPAHVPNGRGTRTADLDYPEGTGVRIVTNATDQALAVLGGLVHALETTIEVAVARLEDDAPDFIEEVQDRLEEEEESSRSLDLPIDGTTARELVKAVVQRVLARAIH
jgi:hypothetical protein